MIKQSYLNLIKPNIVVGNVISSIGGFLIASQGHINYFNLINMLIGITLIIASSCILNNVIDRDIDALMKRTQNRILAKKNTLSIKKIVVYAILLNISGFLFLARIENLLILLLSSIATIIYVGVYSLWAKRKSIYSTIIGSISGAMPPVIGYCSVSHQFDTGAFILLLIFTFWQIPHSYSITIFRSQDYKSAFIPTFFIQKGITMTRIHIIVCILGFSLMTALLTITGYTSYIFLYIISTMNFFWLYIGLYKYRLINDDFLWSKKMFILSVIVITSLNILLSLDSTLFLSYKNSLFI